MFDINLIRDNIDEVKKGLTAKNVEVDLNEILEKDKQYRSLMTGLDDLRSQKNKINDEISRIIKEKNEHHSRQQLYLL